MINKYVEKLKLFKTDACVYSPLTGVKRNIRLGLHLSVRMLSTPKEKEEGWREREEYPHDLKVFYFVLVELGSHYAALAGLELKRSICLCFHRAGIKGVRHHVQLVLKY